MARGAAEFSDGVKAMVFARANGRCERCGSKAVRYQFHHRNARGMGGTRKVTLGLAWNALLLDPSCHDTVESRRTDALALGFLVRTNDDPAEIPVMLAWLGWSVLTSGGGVRVLSVIPPVEFGVPRLPTGP